jgi:hypothetical protein
MQNFNEVGPIFIETVRQTLSNLSDEQAIKVRTKLIEIAGSWTALYLFSQDHFNEKNDEVFADEVFRDWLFNTRYVFFTRVAFAYGQSMVGTVIDLLAQSASLDLGAAEALGLEDQDLVELSGMPEQFPQEILTHTDAKKLLASNNWVVVILLSIAFIPMVHEVLQTPGTNNNQDQ